MCAYTFDIYFKVGAKKIEKFLIQLFTRTCNLQFLLETGNSKNQYR